MEGGRLTGGHLIEVRLYLSPLSIVYMYGLLIKCEVKVAGYWPSSFLRVYGPRRSRSP